MNTESSPGFPLMLRLSGRLCLVVGAGKIARRKVERLRVAGARVRVVAPQIPGEWQADPGMETRCRPFRLADLDGTFLVFAATADRQVNALVAAGAKEAGKLVNIVDDPEGSDFHLPAILQRGELTVTVSSNGRSPALATQLRDRLAGEVGPEWQKFCAIAGALRQKQLTGGEASAYNRAVISDLLAADLPRLLASDDEEAINHLLTQVTGRVMTLASLGIHLGKGTT